MVKNSNSGNIRRGWAPIGKGKEPDQAVAEAVQQLAEQISMPEMEAVIFFCPAACDLPGLASAVASCFDCTVLGCTGAATICGQYHSESIVGISLSSRVFGVHARLIEDCDQFGKAEAWEMVSELRQELKHLRDDGPDPDFGLLLVDGLSQREERVVSALYGVADGMPIVGGSAADELKFEQSLVYFDGAFHGGAAVFAIVETALDFDVFKLEHFEPTGHDLVITDSIPEQRLVTEINGAPAAEEYARMVGKRVEELSAMTFSAHPLMLELGDHWYVRSIEKVNNDGSLTFYSAIDTGLPLTLAMRRDLLAELEAHAVHTARRFSDLELTLGFDCVLRGVELDMQEGGDNARKCAADSLESIAFAGFATFGEQFNGMHVNHTLVGISLGRRAAA